jgi:UDP-N-acetylmuramoyl-tripeptide--D-alanyl-D-alanine ligase
MKSFLLFKYYQLLWRFARRYLAKRKPLIIGINGSVGKTSCRMIIDDVLQANLWDQLSIYTSPKNFNGELGMSLSIFKITDRTPSVSCMISTVRHIISLLKSPEKPYDILILEYGIDRPREMEFLCSICKPHISVLTKLDAVHSLQFGTAEAIANEELKLQANTLLKCYINNNDPHGMNLISSLQTKIAIYNTQHTTTLEKGIIWATDYTIYHNDHSELKLTAPICSQSTLHVSGITMDFATDCIGQIHHDYVALAYDITETIRKQYNLPSITMKTTLSLHLQAGRMSIFEWIHDSIIIDSTYNSSPLSVRKVIEESLMVKNQLFSDRATLYILGEMRELGDSEIQHHLELADYILSKLVTGDKVILLWQAMSHTYERLQWLPFDITHYLDRHDVITKSHDLLTLSPKPYFIIAKGSQNTIFLEEVVKSLLAHPEDSLRLTRQGSFWEEKKR